MLKRGDKREDGKIFWAYAKSSKNGEFWVTPEKFKEKNEKTKYSDQLNKEKRKLRMRELRKTNPKYIYTSTPERKIKDALRYQKNKRIIQARVTKRLKENPQARIAKNLSSRMRHALKGIVKKRKSLQIIGCNTWIEVFNHLNSKLKNGMTWENYGSYWHIDHIVPCAAFDLTIEQQQITCFHYTNLQPLTAQENFQKGKKENGTKQLYIL